MPVGLQVFNDSNIVQIDDTYRNYHYIGSYTVNCTRTLQSTNNRWEFLSIPLVGNAGVFGVFSGTQAFFITGYPSGSTQTLQVFRLGGPGTVTIIYFDLVPPTSGNYGLQVFDAAGSLAFDSSRPCMRVIDVITGFDNPSAGTTDRSYSGKTVGILQSALFYQPSDQPLGDPSQPQTDWVFSENHVYCYASGSSAGVSYQLTDYFQHGSPSISPDGGGSSQMVYLVVDMTNY